MSDQGFKPGEHTPHGKRGGERGWMESYTLESFFCIKYLVPKRKESTQFFLSQTWSNQLNFASNHLHNRWTVDLLWQSVRQAMMIFLIAADYPKQQTIPHFSQWAGTLNEHTREQELYLKWRISWTQRVYGIQVCFLLERLQEKPIQTVYGAQVDPFHQPGG